MKCPKCFWHDNRETCSVCTHNVPLDRRHMKEEHHNRKKSKETFYPPEEEEND